MAKRVPQVQVNVRLDEDVVAILEAAAYVERSSVSELVRDVVHARARQWSTDPAVGLAVDARRSREKRVDRLVRDVQEDAPGGTS
jgi:uncharacterized protein (DUF1778 family)